MNTPSVAFCFVLIIWTTSFFAPDLLTAMIGVAIVTMLGCISDDIKRK